MNERSGWWRGVSVLVVVGLSLSGGALLRAQSFLSEAQGKQAREAGKGDPAFQEGLRALDALNWEKAIDLFRESVSHKGGNVDAALYWLAYAEQRAGDRDEALGTIEQLEKSYPASRWINDAKALGVEMQLRHEITLPADQDEDLKLLALNGLMGSEPEKAMPILKKLLVSNNPDKLKDRALFVLVQNPSPEARRLLGEIARTSGNADLQMKAIRYLGMMGSEEARTELASIYKSTSDDQVKKAVLSGLMMSGSRGMLLNVAKTESKPELRQEAIRQLAMSGGKDELWQLYQQETSIQNKKAILQSMFMTADAGKLVEIARSAKEPELKTAAIKSLGMMGGNGHGDVLVSIYESSADQGVRTAVVDALFIQQDVKALVYLARAEKDPHRKAQVVQKLALIHSKEATDYMLEILK